MNQQANSPRADLGMRRRRRRWVAGLTGALLGGCLAIVWMSTNAPEKLPKLDETLYDAADARWRDRELGSYDLEVVVVGRQPGTYLTQVRDHRPIAAFFNGQPLKSERTFATWTVGGMFRTIGYDLQTVAKSTDASPRLELFAEFDPDWGIPRKYRRIEWGTGQELSWTVSRFEIIESGTD